MAAVGTHGQWGLERGVPKVFGESGQLLLNKFFEMSTPSIRKGCDGGEEEVVEEEKKRKIAVHYHLVSLLPERRPTGMGTARANIS